MNRLQLLLFVVILQLFSFSAFSQLIDRKSNDLLYGKIYKERRSTIKGHPFLINDKLHLANVFYKNMNYKNLYIKYDLFNQQIIYYQEINPNMPRFILLNTDYLEGFELINASTKFHYTNSFSHINGLNSNIKYYHLIYDGTIKYIKGSIKIIDELAVNNRYDEYREEVYYYIILNDTAYRIKSKRDFLNLFKNNKKELKKFIKTNKLKIKVWSHADIIKLLMFCESV